MLGEGEKRVGFVLVVSDISISVHDLSNETKWQEMKMEAPFASKEENAVITPEGHHDPGGLIESDHLGIVEATRVPNSNLSVAHLAKTRRSERILLAHPNDTSTLDTAVTFINPHGISAGARIKQTNFPVPASRDEDVADGVKRETLDCVAMATKGRFRRFRATQVPKFHNVISRSGGQDMFSGWVEKNLTDPTGGTVDTRNGVEVLRYPMLLTPTFKGGSFDFPDHDFSIFTARCDNRVVEG